MLLYKPWRRRVDKSRASNAHFEPVSHDPTNLRLIDEELHTPTDVIQKTRTKEPNTSVESVKPSEIAGPA